MIYRHRTLMGFVVLLQTISGVLILVSTDALGATPLAPFLPLGSAAGLLFLGAAALAWWGLRQRFAQSWFFLAFVPSVVMLLIGATSAVNAIYVSHYADGVPRPQAFIAADQFPIILTAVLYAYAVGSEFLLHRAALRKAVKVA